LGICPIRASQVLWAHAPNMPPTPSSNPCSEQMVVFCEICGKECINARGLAVHLGHMHGDDPPWKKRRGMGAGQGGCPEEANDDSDADEGGGAGDVGEPGDDAAAPIPRQQAIREARRHARETLVDPAWEQWARDLRLEAETTWLQEVESLYDRPAACPNTETYRYATLMAMHPGAQFHRALLEADEEEELLLAKVLPPHRPRDCRLSGILQAYATICHACIYICTHLLTWHMPQICPKYAMSRHCGGPFGWWHIRGICHFWPAGRGCPRALPGGCVWHMPHLCHLPGTLPFFGGAQEGVAYLGHMPLWCLLTSFYGAIYAPNMPQICHEPPLRGSIRLVAYKGHMPLLARRARVPTSPSGRVCVAYAPFMPPAPPLRTGGCEWHIRGI